MRVSSKVFLSLGVVQIVCTGVINSAQAQIVESQSSHSSSTTTETDVKGYAFKYKERFRNYAEQIDLGVSKGWLTAEQASSFKSRLDQLKSQEASCGQKGYPKAELDSLEKAVTKFNEDLSTSSSKSTASTQEKSTTSANSDTKPTTTKVSSAKTTKKTTVKKTK